MKNKKINKTSLITVLLAVLGVCLLLVGGIGGARAALTESDDYTAEMTAPTIRVELHENNGEQAVTKLLEGAKIEVGKPYPENLTVKNTGSADAFVRVTIYKYWSKESKNGIEKQVDLDPAFINLFPGSGWVEDEKASTEERSVFYCTQAIPAGSTSSSVLTQISASSKLSQLVNQTVSEDGKTITSIYKYDGLNLNLEASVDAIQVSNGQDAIKTAWGVTNITVDEAAGTLAVNNN